MSEATVASVIERVRERVDPDPAERERLARAVAEVERRAREAVAELPVEADVLQVGSTARGTWISGDRDIDVFVRFSTTLDRETLEEYGLRVGEAALPDGHQEYAEHPYVKGTVDGFDVDLVPCYDVADATAIESAVDRTPFHTAYLDERLDEALASDVRVCKAFLKGVGIYGSDLRTEGFSGYLTELLVAEYGGFEPLLAAAAEWHPPVRIDPEDHATAAFDDPLVVVDPTDPERNVAAVLSATNLARFQHHARAFLAAPDEARFERETPEPLSAEGLREHVARRGTTPVAVVFDAPEIVDDQLYPQLRKSLAGVTDELDRRGFDVLRATALSADRSVLLAELAVASRPRVERHEGPPVHVGEHARRFYEQYADDPDAYGPFVDGDRYVVERERSFASAPEFLRSDALFEVGLGARVASALESEYEVLVGEEVASLADEFGTDLRAVFEPEP